MVTSSTEYPKSNGLLEKTVQTAKAKNLLNKAKEDNKDPYTINVKHKKILVANCKPPVKIGDIWLILPVSLNNMTVKPADTYPSSE